MAQEKRYTDYIPYDQAKLKAANYCVYQDRTQEQVRQKLFKLGINEDETEQIIAELISENFIDEMRFAESYARGKLRHNAWGIKKIEQGLKQHGLTGYCIKKGMQSIDAEEYQAVLLKKATQKWESLSGIKEQERIMKTRRYLFGKGFEQDETNAVIEEIRQEHKNI